MQMWHICTTGPKVPSTALNIIGYLKQYLMIFNRALNLEEKKIISNIHYANVA